MKGRYDTWIRSLGRKNGERLTGKGLIEKGLAGKGKRLTGLLAGFLGMTLLCGCSLAKEEFVSDGEDRLVGVFLTEEYPDTGAAELEINWKGEISFSEEAARIPGEIFWEEEEGRYEKWPRIIFEGVEGYGIYSVSLWNEEYQNYVECSFSDNIFEETKVIVGDSCDSTETTVFVEPGGIQSFCVNQVYQTPQGEVYMKPGHSLSSEMTAGASVSTSLTWQKKESRNEEETEEKVEFTVNIVCAVADAPIRLLLMGEDNNVLDELEEKQLEQILAEENHRLQIPAETAYLIVEREGADGAILREICERGEETINFQQSRGDRYLEGAYLSLVWQ